ncbi:MAG: hypothetical protein AVDCRST_MAG49-4257 [uncultured Thermomicrobiales bacterium]|uniref:non-specific serine/threonine protein kinase n=1 Tax=uncultured Thermomicrobiales bacterium TaxID=1645740 RepID=A0A6J4VE46_9BACT|nr:MAG: hypothetical protein AVDCRST_MAG49-4257 [uncultured Thermomicrobiales bacterium]
MADEPSDSGSTLDRLPTGVPGFDVVLGGGLVRGGTSLVLGEPGTGKTTLGNQLAFRHGEAGNTTLFVTVLAEPHDRMLRHIDGFAFFAPDQVGRTVHFLSLYDELRAQGLDGSLALLRRLIRQYGATLVIIDGAGRFEDFAPSPGEHRRFVAELHVQLAVLECTAVLLTQSGNGGDALHGLGTHVDGIVILEDQSVDDRAVRRLRIVKLRGSDTVRGWHQFAITDEGIEVYPRLEATAPLTRPEVRGPRRRLPLGIAGLDDMLRGGVLTGSTTLVLGPPGIGKTTVGLHFIDAGAERGERGMIAGFQEAPDRLLAKAEGLGLRDHVEAGRVRIGWQPSAEGPLDGWAHGLLAAIDAHRPERLLVDALTDAAQLPAAEGRWSGFVAALAHALRGRGVTAVFTAETRTGEASEDPLPEVAPAIDNALVLRYAEPRSRLHRLISVARSRDSGFDPETREFEITDHGIEVASSAESARSALDGPARPADGG